MYDPIATVLGTWAADLSVGAIFLRIGLSLLLSAILGCERSGKRHAAGLRTFIIASVGATVAILSDLYFIEVLGLGFPFLSAAVVVAAAIIASNSILFSSKSQIKGLTTAAGLWTVGILGLLIGAGFYTVAIFGFFAIMICLSFFPSMERHFKNKSNHFEVHLELKKKENLQSFVATIRQLGLRIDDIEVNPAYINSGLSVYSISLTIQSAELKKYKTHSEIIDALRSIEYIHHIEEMP